MADDGSQVMDATKQPRTRHVLRNLLLFFFCIPSILGFASLLFGFGLWDVHGFSGWFTLSMAGIGAWTLTSSIVSGGRERIDWFPLIIVGLLTCLWIYVRTFR
jgi:hypothetical protein